MSEKDNLYNNILNWISNNQDKVIIAQQIAKKIDELKLINSHRALPFQITPSEENPETFKLTVFMDHPKIGSFEFCILDEGISIKNLDNLDESWDLFTQDELINFIEKFNDEDLNTFIDLRSAIETRNYTIINKIISSELKKYKQIVDPEFKSIKKYLTTTENIGLTNPSDGTVSYLNRVMGRWDLALLWSPCPFVVVSNPVETEKLQDKIYDFKIKEQESCSLINNMQKLCALCDMDVEIRTDSKDSEMDASGWVTFDEFGIPKIGPLIHAVKINIYSKFEGNLRKEQFSKGILLG